MNCLIGWCLSRIFEYFTTGGGYRINMIFLEYIGTWRFRWIIFIHCSQCRRKAQVLLTLTENNQLFFSKDFAIFFFFFFFLKIIIMSTSNCFFKNCFCSYHFSVTSSFFASWVLIPASHWRSRQAFFSVFFVLTKMTGMLKVLHKRSDHMVITMTNLKRRHKLNWSSD